MLCRRPGHEAAARQLFALGASARERLLGGLASPRNGLQLPFQLVTPCPGRGGIRLGLPQRGEARPELVTAELPSGLERLSLQPGMKLGRLGLALERAQPRTCFALDVQRAIEIVLRAQQLQLRPPPPLAVLA